MGHWSPGTSRKMPKRASKCGFESHTLRTRIPGQALVSGINHGGCHHSMPPARRCTQNARVAAWQRTVVKVTVWAYSCRMAAMQTVTIPVQLQISLTHLAPQRSGTTGCCGHTPFELKRTDRMTNDLALVTCPGAWMVKR
jgi:hypothetical protein